MPSNIAMQKATSGGIRLGIPGYMSTAQPTNILDVPISDGLNDALRMYLLRQAVKEGE